MTNDKEPAAKKWIDDAEKALNRTAESLKAAWEGTRETRMATLQSAKEAAAKLGEAIDQGIDVAKETWDPARKEQEAAATEATPEEEPEPTADDSTEEE